MEKERLTEDIKYRIELLRLTSLVSLAVGGGVVGLLAPVLNRVVLASGGIALLALLVALVVYLDRRIRSAIAAL
jgi:hypothetical protein